MINTVILTSRSLWGHLDGLLKLHGPIFQNLVYISFEGSSDQRCKFKISVKSVKPFWFGKQWFCIMQLPVQFLCIKLHDYGYHNQTLFYSYLPKTTLFSHEISHGLWGKYELSCDTKIPKRWGKSWKDRMDPFKVLTHRILFTIHKRSQT